MSDNVLLSGLQGHLPPFERIQPEHVLPTLDAVLAESRLQIDELIAQADPDWNSLMQPLEELDEKLHRVWSPVSHLNSVCDSEKLRPIYQQGVQKMAAWHSEVAQNEALYAAIKMVAGRTDFSSLSPAQQQSSEHMLRDFRLSGAELEGAARERFTAIRMRLSELGTLFEQHVLDATRVFELHITEEADLAGIPDSVRDAARQRAEGAEGAGKGGWLFTLDIPSYLPFMQYAENRALRERMYTAYSTRASSGELDNSPVIDELLALRKEMANLLGFDTYAEYSLATKMAASTGEVTSFLRELAAKSRAMAEAEVAELKTFAAEKLGIAELAAWDVPFVSEHLRQHKYAISREELKPYFPEHKVIEGLFGLVSKLYGLSIRETEAPRWHKDVRYFEVSDASGDVIAGFYLDPYARAHKRGGAWMDECMLRWKRPDGSLQLPVAYLVCNFDAPVGSKPALWTHEEVETLFHEFGHGLHHMLTRVDVRGVSGINGVPWDAVELPSQFMENFCWEREGVDLFARHYQSGEKLPDELFDRMLAAKNFQSGMMMLRQIEFSLFDFLLHSDYQSGGEQSVQALLDEVRREVAVLMPPAFNKFQNSFSHIFAGGYAAGYYSYKWAEVLSADAFSAFEEHGITDAVTAKRFRDEILSVGGSRDLMQSFEAFRGRKPSVEALLRHSGITNEEIFSQE